jgi:hypothetical protein
MSNPRWTDDEMRETLDASAEKSRQITRLTAENERIRTALVSTTASLVAAISLLNRGGKKAAPSDRMFTMMLDDYQKTVLEARAALTQETRDE